MKSAVLGGGSWGTALALLLSQDGETVHLWDRNPDMARAIQTDRENKRYLPGFALPHSVESTSDIARALAGVSCVVVAVPSSAVRSVLTLAAPVLPDGCDIVVAAKGMEADTHLLPSEVAAQVLIARPHLPLVALSGPNLAVEVARQVPTAAVAACPDASAAARVAARLSRAGHSRPAYRLYTSDDRTGVELGGAIKNVLAIAGGVSDGLGYGDNTKAALLTRGLAEMTRMGAACGARIETFYGLAGVGDLMATAASRLSRNWRVGEGVARGEALDAILARLGQVAEGVSTARALYGLAREKQVEMPVCEAVHALLFDGVSPHDAVNALLSRARKDEAD